MNITIVDKNNKLVADVSIDFENKSINSIISNEYRVIEEGEVNI